MAKAKKTEQHQLILGDKRFAMPEMSTTDYFDYCDISEEIDGVQYYRRQHYMKMAEGIALAYGNQFTAAEVIEHLKPADIIVEYSLIEVFVVKDVDDRAEEIRENFTSFT